MTTPSSTLASFNNPENVAFQAVNEFVAAVKWNKEVGSDVHVIKELTVRRVDASSDCYSE